MSAPSEPLREPMEAGPAMNAAVAEFVMGIVPRELRVCGEVLMPLVRVWTPGDWPEDGWHSRAYLEAKGAPRCYSTDIAAAWLVVEKLMVDVFGVTVGTNHESGWWCTVSLSSGVKLDAVGTSCPLAICKAALAAVSTGSDQP